MKWKSIKVSEETYALVSKARDEFLRHHKVFKGLHISNDTIISRSLRYYIEQ